MIDEQYDAIVIGAGHNGLVCAALLAKAGLSTVVLEARDRVGGMAETRDFHDGYAVPGCAHFLYALDPAVEKAIDLRLPLAEADVATLVLGEDGQHVRLQGTVAAGVSDVDAAEYARFIADMKKLARFLTRQFRRAPPRFKGEASPWLRLAFELRSLGRGPMRELLRLIGQNMHDEANARFDHPLLKAALCLDAVTGSHAGPRSPGNVVAWLGRLAANGGRIAQPHGGMGAIAEAIAGRAASHGADIRIGASVDRVVVEHGRVRGVVVDGTTVSAPLVVSGLDPQTTVQRLVGERHFEATFVRRIRHYRARGNVSKLHLALDGLPAVPGMRREDFASRLIVATDENAIEQAFNPAKYGQCSERPVIELSIPSVSDDTLAPHGHHVASAIVQYTPYDLRGGWTDEARDALADRVVATLETRLPGIAGRIVATELLTPVDIEAEYGVAGGHWHHGETSLDQFMFVRPVVGSARYALPIDGLWLCGAGAHPGGGISGLPGMNAARAILAERSR